MRSYRKPRSRLLQVERRSGLVDQLGAGSGLDSEFPPEGTTDADVTPQQREPRRSQNLLLCSYLRERRTLIGQYKLSVPVIL